MSQLYDKMAEGTLLVVVCQGALTSMVNLMAKRTKSRWDANNRERMDVVSGQKRNRAQSKCPPRCIVSSVELARTRWSMHFTTLFY